MKLDVFPLTLHEMDTSSFKYFSFEFPILFSSAYSSYDHHHGHSGYGSKHTTVWLKIAPFDLLTLAAFLAAAVFLLNEILVVILMLMRRKKRRKKRSPNEEIPNCDFILRGKYQSQKIANSPRKRKNSMNRKDHRNSKNHDFSIFEASKVIFVSVCCFPFKRQHYVQLRQQLLQLLLSSAGQIPAGQ